MGVIERVLARLVAVAIGLACTAAPMPADARAPDDNLSVAPAEDADDGRPTQSHQRLTARSAKRAASMHVRTHALAAQIAALAPARTVVTIDLVPPSRGRVAPADEPASARDPPLT